MTVAELIKELEKIEDKSLEVVADLGRDFCDYPKAELVEGVIETEECLDATENGLWDTRIIKCIKII